MILIALTLIATPAAQAHPKTAGSTVLLTALSPAAQSHVSASPVAGSLGRRTVTRTLGIATESDGEADSRRCRSHRRGLIYYRLRTNAWLALRGIHREVNLAQPHGCAHALWAAKQWRAKARIARLAYYAWREVQWVLREQRTWRAAVEHVQRAYPGTEGWLLSCSSTEGGHGRWVPNRDGAPPGGWLQFYRSTWVRMFGLQGYSGALQDLARRGFKVDRKTHSWYSPVGQALAGAWGLTHGRVGEWNSSGC